METEGWVRDKVCRDIHYNVKKFNNTYYKIEISCDLGAKVVKSWVALSSGKKRKHLDNFIPDSLPRDGGIQALIWVKKEVLDFYTYFDTQYFANMFQKMYVCIHWEGGRRRDIYSRLQNEGFVFANDKGIKILRKEIKLELR